MNKHQHTSTTACLLGHSLDKQFDDGKWYRGTVTEYNLSTEYFMISYEDGDREEMTHREIRAYRQATPFYPARYPGAVPTSSSSRCSNSGSSSLSIERRQKGSHCKKGKKENASAAETPQPALRRCKRLTARRPPGYRSRRLSVQAQRNLIINSLARFQENPVKSNKGH